jgi:site-specific recombinase XerD
MKEPLCSEAKTASRDAASSCDRVLLIAGFANDGRLCYLQTYKRGIEDIGRTWGSWKNFWLHKFRATFATWALWAGVDLRTVQQWLGHSDIESTMRYLKPSRSQQVHDKVNEIFA